MYTTKGLDFSTKHPALIVGPPYSGVKERGPGIYAQEMAKRGYVALAFDPSFNGFRGGEPHHVSSPDIFVEDFMASVDYLGTRDYVDRDRIGVIGICGSGSFALSAAQVDMRIKAVATASMVDISAAQQQGTKDERQARLTEIGEQRYVDFTSDQPFMGPRGSALADETDDPVFREFGDFYFTSRGWHPNAITTVALSSSMSFMNFNLLDKIAEISTRPIMLIVGENVFSKGFSEMAFAAAQDPKELVMVPNANHIDLYDDLKTIPFDQLQQFFDSSLYRLTN
ncbi:alpha/beta hydrolase [Secundilactobacillus kimchicus]|uniref:alpha/beta hydrolase n=1 Tax=Secundilactobacillus kimchicus TaxID=528209 RepID=UPI0030B86E24